MDQERTSFQQRARESDSATCLAQKIPLVRESDIHTEIILLMSVAYDGIRKMMDIYDKIRDSRGLQFGHDTVQQWFPVNRNQSLGQRVCDRSEPRAKPRRENHRLHLQNLLYVQLSV